MSVEQSEVESTLSKVAGKYLTFKLCNESYGIGVLQIREIIRMQTITPMPQMPHFVKGVTNLRGKVIPVISLRLKFSLSDAETNEQSCIIVVDAKSSSGRDVLMGLVVDGVEEVINITTDEIEPAPDFGAFVDTHYMLGMAKIKGVVKTLLDINRVVGNENIDQLAANG
ncbi:MAG: chemotaxis protein CheW [Verrucomicrobiota bacterium]